MAKLSQISTTNPQTPNNTFTSIAPPPKKNCIKSIPYTLVRRIYNIIIDKNLRKTRLYKLHTTLHQRRYPTTLIVPSKELRNPKRHDNQKSLAYVATSNKNNPELFTEIIKNLEEFKNNDKIKEIQDTTKVIKNQRQPKILKEYSPLLYSGKKTTQGITKRKNKRCRVCDIIIEGKSYSFKNPETKFL